MSDLSVASRTSVNLEYASFVLGTKNVSHYPLQVRL